MSDSSLLVLPPDPESPARSCETASGSEPSAAPEILYLSRKDVEEAIEWINEQYPDHRIMQPEVLLDSANPIREEGIFIKVVDYCTSMDGLREYNIELEILRLAWNTPAPGIQIRSPDVNRRTCFVPYDRPVWSDVLMCAYLRTQIDLQDHYHDWRTSEGFERCGAWASEQSAKLQSLTFSHTWFRMSDKWRSHDFVDLSKSIPEVAGETSVISLCSQFIPLREGSPCTILYESSSQMHEYVDVWLWLTYVCWELTKMNNEMWSLFSAIETLVEVPSDFVHSLEARDRLQFADDDFSSTRRYFWASQTLKLMKKFIDEALDKIEWLTQEDNGFLQRCTQSGSSTANLRNQETMLLQDLKRTQNCLISLKPAIDTLRKEAAELNTVLDQGTALLQAQRSVEQATLLVAAERRGLSAWLFSAIALTFLPLTFVTSIFGMTNMPPNANFKPFIWTTLAICIPTWILGLLCIAFGTSWGEYWKGRVIRKVKDWYRHSRGRELDWDITSSYFASGSTTRSSLRLSNPDTRGADPENPPMVHAAPIDEP